MVMGKRGAVVWAAALAGVGQIPAQGAEPTTVPAAQATSASSTAPAAMAELARQGSRFIKAHDPSTIIKCGSDYWMFATGRGISGFHSKDRVKWEQGRPVLDQPPAWVGQVVPGVRAGYDYFWAPDVVRVGEKYLLYYSVSSWGKNASAIALASNATLDPAEPNYHWTDEGVVVQSHGGDTFNAIDPGIVRDRDGGLWMVFGSFWSGIKLVQLDAKTGKRMAGDGPMYALASAKQIEGPYLRYHEGFYYLFVNWGWCCRGKSSTYNIRMGRSEKITGPYVDEEGKDLLHGGGTLLLGTEGAFIGPGSVGILEEEGKFWLSMHFYDGTTPRGTGTLAIRALHWGNEGWPGVE